MNIMSSRKVAVAMLLACSLAVYAQKPTTDSAKTVTSIPPTTKIAAKNSDNKTAKKSEKVKAAADTQAVNFAQPIIPANIPVAKKVEPKGIRMSLDECIKIALSDNPTIKVADMEIQRLNLAKKETIGQLLPSISLAGQYSRTIQKQTMYLNIPNMSGGGTSGGGSEDTNLQAGEDESKDKKQGIKMGLDNSYSIGLQASMPIVAPQLWKALHINDTQILQNIETARSSRLSLVNQVKNAYYALLLAIDTQGAIEESYANAKYTADIYKAKKEQGTASEFDVLRSDVALKSIEPTLYQAEIGVRSTRLQLCLLMGMSQEIDILPASKLTDYERTMYANTLALDNTLDNNTNLRQLDLNTRLLRENLDVQKAAWYPTLALTANYTFTSMSNGSIFKNFNWNPYSTVGLALSFPIFTGGQRVAKIKQAQIQLDEMKWQRENLERSICLQVQVATDNINKNVKQIATSAETVIMAEKANQIQEKCFQIGVGSYLDYRDSQLALTQAKLAYYQSIYDYLVANSNLELLLGNADLEKYSPSPEANNSLDSQKAPINTPENK